MSGGLQTSARRYLDILRMTATELLREGLCGFYHQLAGNQRKWEVEDQASKLPVETMYLSMTPSHLHYKKDDCGLE